MNAQPKRRGLWLLVTGILLLLLLAVVWSLKADDYLRHLTIRAVEAESDYRLQIDGPFKVSLFTGKTVEATGIKLYPKRQPDPLLQIGNAQLRFSFWSLLSGNPRIERLIVDQVLFDPDADPRPKESATLDPADLSWLPVVERLVLRNIRLDQQEPAQTLSIQVLLSEVTFDLAQDGGSYRVEGQTLIAEQGFQLSGRIGSLAALPAADSPYPVNLEIANPALKLSVDGSIDRPLSGEGLRFSLASEASELASALALLQLELPPLGRLTANARLQGDFEDASLQDIDASLELTGKLRLEASGSLQGLTTTPDGALDIKGFIKERAVSALLLPSDMASIDDWQLQGRLNLSGKQLGFENFKAQGVDRAGLKLGVQGKGVFGDPQQPQPFASLDLLLAIDADNTKAAQSLLIEDLPEMGPVQGSARLTAPAGDHFAIEDYQAKVGREQEMWISYSGRIGHIPLATGLPSTEIDLQIRFAAARTERLAYLWGVSLPELGPVKYSGHFVGSEAEGMFKELSFSAGKESALKLDASGQLLLGDSRTSEPPRSIDVSVAFATPETAPVAQLVGNTLPELGPIKGRFNLTGQLQGLKVSEIDMTAGDAETLTLSATGGIEKLRLEPKVSYTGINLNLTAASPSSKKFLPLLALSAADLGAMTASGMLVDADGSLGLEKTQIHFHQPDLLDIRVSGQLDDLKAWDQLDANLALSAANLKVIAAILGGQWRDSSAAVKADGQLHLEADKLGYAGSANVGQTEIAVKVSGSLQGGNPRLEGTLSSKVLYLTDFGYPETAKQMKKERLAAAAEIKQELEQKDAGKDDKAPVERLFSPDPLPWELLQTLDLRLGLSIGQIEGAGSTLDALAAEIELKGGRLLISPAVLDYSEGTLLLDLMLDGNDRPSAAFKLHADDVAIGKAWSHVQAFVPVSGNINVDIDLSSSGASPADLAANLNGVIGIASENLEVPYYTADLLAVNVLGWVVKKALSSDATVLVHCSIMQTKVQQGRADIQRLFFDGPNMTVSGEGWIDLGAESIDVSIFPTRKNGIWSEANPVRLSGALADPEIGVTVVDKKTAAAAGAAAGVAAGAVAVPVLVIPAVAIGALWEMIAGDEDKGEDSPCLQYLAPAE